HTGALYKYYLQFPWQTYGFHLLDGGPFIPRQHSRNQKFLTRMNKLKTTKMGRGHKVVRAKDFDERVNNGKNTLLRTKN
ncbi:hypothetical protein, partial [Caldithrix abyssi]